MIDAPSSLCPEDERISDCSGQDSPVSDRCNASACNLQDQTRVYDSSDGDHLRQEAQNAAVFGPLAICIARVLRRSFNTK